MWFNSLVFSYQIMRLANGKNNVLVDLPANFWWAPYEVVLLGKKGEHKEIRSTNELGEYLVFTVPDSWHVQVTIKYRGWLWNREKVINISIPIRLKPVTNLRYEII
jgi:hypothetical protein